MINKRTSLPGTPTHHTPQSPSYWQAQPSSSAITSRLRSADTRSIDGSPSSTRSGAGVGGGNMEQSTGGLGLGMSLGAPIGAGMGDSGSAQRSPPPHSYSQSHSQSQSQQQHTQTPAPTPAQVYARGHGATGSLGGATGHGHGHGHGSGSTSGQGGHTQPHRRANADGTGSGSGGGHEAKAVALLVSKLVNKLPCNSGIRLALVEADPSVQATVASLRRIAAIRLPTVLYALMSALETLAKYSSATLATTPTDTIHSQIYVFYILNSCLSAGRQAETFLDDSLARQLLLVTLNFAAMIKTANAAMPERSASPSNMLHSATGRMREASSSSSIARIASSISSSALGGSPGRASSRTTRRSLLPAAKFKAARSISSSMSMNASTSTASLSGGASASNISVSATAAEAADQLAEQLRQLVGVLTMSNWPLMMTRIRSRVSQLCTTIDESPDMTEFYLVQWAQLDRPRLAQIIQEFSSCFLHLKRPAQAGAAIALRQCIWNFIDTQPEAFAALIESGRKIEGGPDVLFDALYSASDLSSSSGAKRTRAFYPLMAMLMVLCPDIMKRIAMGETARSGSSATGKKVAYFDSLKKGLGSSKGIEACASSLVDLVRASVRLADGYEGETSGLRGMVSEIQSDLKNALYISSSSNDITDPDILIDGLIGLTRLDTRGADTLFVKLLADNNDVKRIVALRAAQVLLDEQDMTIGLGSLRQALAVPLRYLVTSAAQKLVGDRSTNRRATLPTSDTPSRVLAEAIRLISINPSLAWTQATQRDAQNFIITLGSLTVGPSPPILRRYAVEAVVEIMADLASSHLEEEADLARTLGPAVSTALIDTSRQALFDMEALDLEAFELTAILTRDLVRALLGFVRIYPETLAEPSVSKPCIVIASQCLWGAAMLLDTRTASTIIIPAMKTIQSLMKVVFQPVLNRLEPSDPHVAVIHARLAIYDAIAAMPPPVGRQHYQRNFRALHREMKSASPVLPGLWISARATLRQLASKIMAGETAAAAGKGSATGITGLTEEEARIWQDTLGNMTAASAICIIGPSPKPSVTELLGTDLLPAAYEQGDPQPAMLDDLLAETLALMASHNVTVRETVKEALGHELPLRCGQVMFVQLAKLMSQAATMSSTASEYFTTLCDQTIAIIRLTADRAARLDQSASATPNSVQDDGARTSFGDVSEILVVVGRHLHRLPREEGARLKLRYCQMLEAVLERQGFGIGTSGANTILDLLLEWSNESGQEYDSNHLSVTGARMNRDVEHTSLKVISQITDGLILHVPGTGGADNSNQSQSAATARSRLFNRIYAYLLRMLERSAFGFDNADSSQRRQGSDPRRSGGTCTEDIAALAITALSNLLSSNVDVGLKHCLAMGYHAKPELRSAFMQVMTRAMRNGAPIAGTATADAASASKRRSALGRPFIDALNVGNMALAVACVEVCPVGPEVDEMSTLLFRVMEAKGLLLPFLRVLVEREVALTNHESELFRANSITTRMLTHFAKTYGYNYVRATLQPLIKQIIEKPAGTSFELDPTKAGPNEDMQKNAEHLKLICQALLDLICTSLPMVPTMFRALCHYIWEAVEDRFPESRHSAVGSFIFLRFFCPSIVAPDNIDLDMPADSRDLRRGLLMTTKVIQSLANNVVFGNKESHMKVLNDFLGANIRQVTKFLADVAQRPRSHEIQSVVKACKEEGERLIDAEHDELILNRFIRKHLNKIEAAMVQLPQSFRKPSPSRPDKLPLDGRLALDRLREVLEHNPVPVEETKLPSAVRGQHHEDFMRRHAGRRTESVAKIFYEGPEGQSGRRVFYFILSNVGLADYDLLGYRIFQLLSNVSDPFDVIVDTTGYTASTDLPMSWLIKMVQICPPSILSLMHTLALYNPNTYTRRRCRRIAADIAAVASGHPRNVVAACSPQELQELMPVPSLLLPEYTMQLAYEAVRTYQNFVLVTDHDMHVGVLVKVGETSLQIRPTRQCELLPDVKAHVLDVIAYKDIDEMVAGTGSIADRLTVRFNSTESITLIASAESPYDGSSTQTDTALAADSARAARSELQGLIRGARARLQETASVAGDKVVRPSEVPGTLLYMALAGLCSTDEGLRAQAYTLLGEVEAYAKFDEGSRPVRVDFGLLVPSNTTRFACEMSTQVAMKSPALTLDFLKEWTNGFSRSGIQHKIATTLLLQPWLPNLEAFCHPAHASPDSTKLLHDVIRSLISVTMNEFADLHLLLQERVWRVLAKLGGIMPEILFSELLKAGIEAQLGSSRAASVGDILVTISSPGIRGKLIARLRKAIARTSQVPSATLLDNSIWPEICMLVQYNALLVFGPFTAIDAQLHLPELLHSITMLVGIGSLAVRQTLYSLMINLLRSLACMSQSGESNPALLSNLLDQAQEDQILACFGLAKSDGLAGLTSCIKEDEGVLVLEDVQTLADFLLQVFAAASPSSDQTLAWRMRWLGFVAETCFRHREHRSATLPQAFIILGCLVPEAVEYELIEQTLAAISRVLSRYTEADSLLVNSMLHSLAKAVSFIMDDIGTVQALLCISLGILQIGHIPLFNAGLDLLMASLRNLDGASMFDRGLTEGILDARDGAGPAAVKLDEYNGVNMVRERDVNFSIVGIVWKGVRHPATRDSTIEALSLLLDIATRKRLEIDPIDGSIGDEAVPYFIGLLPIMVSIGQPEVDRLMKLARVEGLDEHEVFDALDTPDNSSALLVVTMAITMLNTAATDAERAVLFSLLAQASTEIPEVVAMMYDILVPRLTQVLSNTTSPAISNAITTILERATSDGFYDFASPNGTIDANGSEPSLPAYTVDDAAGAPRNDSASSASTPVPGGRPVRLQTLPRTGFSGTALLEDIGMEGLGEMSFAVGNPERMGNMATCLSDLVAFYTGANE